MDAALRTLITNTLFTLVNFVWRRLVTIINPPRDTFWAIPSAALWRMRPVTARVWEEQTT